MWKLNFVFFKGQINEKKKNIFKTRFLFSDSNKGFKFVADVGHRTPSRRNNVRSTFKLLKADSEAEEVGLISVPS